MIRNPKGSSPRTRFSREILDALPAEATTPKLALALGVNRSMVIRFKRLGMPFRSVTMGKSIADVFVKQDVIDWLLKSNRAYPDEWTRELFDV